MATIRRFLSYDNSRTLIKQKVSVLFEGGGDFFRESNI